MDKTQSENYLTSLLNKTLRITTTDTRMFLGQFKCTDSVCSFAPTSFASQLINMLSQDLNIILSQTYEYRLPPPPKPTSSSTSSSTPVTLDMTSRYVGLVVVPGQYITRIEVEEFESQIKGKGMGSGKMVGEGLRGKEKDMSKGEPFCAGGVCEPASV